MKGDVHDCYKKYRDEWKKTGCTILCDSYSDGMTKTIVFSVTCPNRTLFLKLIDIAGREDDGS